MKRCYYETLEVDRNADESRLKAAFRKLAMKWHPDKNPGDAASEVKFKEINEAYEVLKDGDKRAAYDRYGHAAFEQGMGGGRPLPCRLTSGLWAACFLSFRLIDRDLSR
jgi:molecular chaperone DnaJ